MALPVLGLTPFQSTPSVWRETPAAVCVHNRRTHFNPLPPYGGRPHVRLLQDLRQPFQSTPSVWRETNKDVLDQITQEISIHSLRMEGDVVPLATVIQSVLYFNPLPPYGGRPVTVSSPSAQNPFQSTPSVWRETSRSIIAGSPSTISIHSLRMEGDSKTAQESVFHFAYPCTILQKRMQKTTFCTRKNDFFRKKGEKFGAKPPASFCAPMIRTDIFPQTSLTESAALPCLWFPLHRYVPPSTDNDFPGNKTAGCPFLYQSPVPADA